MTELIQRQLITIFFMSICGLNIGLVTDIFKVFVRYLLGNKKYLVVIIYILETIVMAYLIQEYSFFCQNGKITFMGIVAFFIGLLLWYKYFYGIISLGEEHEQKRKEAPRVRKKQ